MKTINKIIIATLLLSACVNQKAIETTAIHPPTPSIAATDNIRTPGIYKAYPTGRYEDPNDSDIMHEAHTIYRQEQQERWDLSPNAPTYVPLGPIGVVANPGIQRAPLTAELEKRIVEQNRLLVATRDQNERLQTDMASMRDEIMHLAQVGGSNTVVQSALNERDKKLAKLERRAEEQQVTIEMLKTRIQSQMSGTGIVIRTSQ